MDEIKKIEKNEETGTPSATPNEPVEEPPILPSIEDVVIGYHLTNFLLRLIALL